MRRNKDMTVIPHRTCVGIRAIIGKGQIIVLFAVLDLQLVIQYWSRYRLSASGHICNIDNNIDNFGNIDNIFDILESHSFRCVRKLREAVTHR